MIISAEDFYATSSGHHAIRLFNFIFFEGLYFQENFIWKTSILKTRKKTCLKWFTRMKDIQGS